MHIHVQLAWSEPHTSGFSRDTYHFHIFISEFYGLRNNRKSGTNVPMARHRRGIYLVSHSVEDFHLSRVMRKLTLWFPTWSDTNQAVQLQKIARGLKFCIWKVEGLYYLSSENKGADQLRGYREADLRLSFRICKTLVFS